MSGGCSRLTSRIYTYTQTLQDHIADKERMDAELASLTAEIQALKTEFDHKLMCVPPCLS